MFCLPKFTADVLREKFRSGEINPNKLSELDSAGRREAFSFMGLENAKRVNAMFEQALLRKNQEKAMINWAKQILGDKPEILKDTLSKVQRNTELLTKEEIDMFLEDLIERKLGVAVTEKEAATLVELSRKVDEKRAALDLPTAEGTSRDYLRTETPAQYQQRLEYGLALETFNQYVAELKVSNMGQVKKDWAALAGESLDVSKSLVSSLDDSVWGNQAVTQLLDPRYTDLWVKNLLKSFGDIKESLKGNDPLIGVRAEILSRPDAVNGLYRRENLAVGIKEEAFPTSLPEKMSKLPVVGKALVPLERLYKASSNAYHAALLRLRADIADRVNSLSRKAGVDLTDKANAEGIGKFVNSGTGRGSLGVGEPALGFWNRVFFSPRLMKGTFDVLTMGLMDKGIRTNPLARKLAAQRLMAMTATYIGVMSLIEALNPNSTEIDPRGIHFGEVKIGNKWINVIGPYRPMIRAVARIIPTYRHDAPGKFWDRVGAWSKTTDGEWKRHEYFGEEIPKFGSYTPLDVAEDFFENKASAPLAAFLAMAKGKDFKGDPVTPEATALKLITPLSLNNLIEDVNDPETEGWFANYILSIFGFNAREYK